MQEVALRPPAAAPACEVDAELGGRSCRHREPRHRRRRAMEVMAEGTAAAELAMSTHKVAARGPTGTMAGGSWRRRRRGMERAEGPEAALNARDVLHLCEDDPVRGGRRHVPRLVGEGATLPQGAEAARVVPAREAAGGGGWRRCVLRRDAPEGRQKRVAMRSLRFGEQCQPTKAQSLVEAIDARHQRRRRRRHYLQVTCIELQEAGDDLCQL
mmetsp:Transcript_60914/g.170758  ORF Transcript_60914/g.170758 Transcript_60914/m.170758 type:complete len:213 (+) Transcript_60914:169-807(+)